MKKSIQVFLSLLCSMFFIHGCTTPASTSPKQETVDYVYGTLDLPYADFYYGELNNVQPNKGKQTLASNKEDQVKEEGYRKLGMYDAVSSVTLDKASSFEQVFYEEQEGKMKILGIKEVNVAIDRSLYEEAKQALEEGGNTDLLILKWIQDWKISESKPLEYKVLNSDGVFSQTVGESTKPEGLRASISTSSTWGNYEILIEGLENIENLDLTTENLAGAILETDDGKKYGLEHLDNLWLRPEDIAFSVQEFKEPHGNTPAYQRFSDIPGKTIKKITYLLNNQADIEIETDLYCKKMLDKEQGITIPETIAFDQAGSILALQKNLPQDSHYSLSLVKKSNGEEIKDYTEEEQQVILDHSIKAGKYTLTWSDDTYGDIGLTVLVESKLLDSVFFIADNQISLSQNEEEVSVTDYLAAISKVTINQKEIKSRNLATLLFDLDGKILFDAELIDREGNVEAIFEKNKEYHLELEAFGFPRISGSIQS